MSIITPGELNIGDWVTVFEEAETVPDWNNNSFHIYQGDKPKSAYAMFKGVPMEVVGVCLPYTLCKATHEIRWNGFFSSGTELREQHIMIDTRNAVLMSVSEEFRNSYLKLITPIEKPPKMAVEFK